MKHILKLRFQVSKKMYRNDFYNLLRLSLLPFHYFFDYTNRNHAVRENAVLSKDKPYMNLDTITAIHLNDDRLPYREQEVFLVVSYHNNLGYDK